MRLAAEECWARLATARHGYLATRHASRGVDAVPVVLAVTPERSVLLPVDRVKPKGSTHLQRLANLELDDRCAVLVDHYDDDWSQLWWVRLHGRARARSPWPEGRQLLADAFASYRDPATIAAIIVVLPDQISGWAAVAP